jgi:hypothetical protein
MSTFIDIGFLLSGVLTLVIIVRTLISKED